LRGERLSVGSDEPAEEVMVRLGSVVIRQLEREGEATPTLASSLS
jgi:anti-sigma factor RsiW